MEQKYISDLISNNEIENWNKGDIITIKAGTGAGKSHFIKNRLFLFAKDNSRKILMLVHRKSTLMQFTHELKSHSALDIIKIDTYQSIETIYKNNGKFNFDKYDYIICDEFHYFMSDSSMNRYTDLSLNAILKQNKQVKIFMSATGDYMARYINEEKGLQTIPYEMSNGNINRINHLVFFNKKDDYVVLTDYFIKHKEKTIFFIDNDMVHELYQKHKDYSLFYCSDNYKHVKSRKDNMIEEMLRNERFEELFLFTTSVMDAGVNIIDKDLVNIVVDIKDAGKLIQCIGRKRFKNKDEKINVFIRNIPNQRLGGYKTIYNKRLTKAECLIWEGKDNYIQKYGRDPDMYSIVYDEIDEDGAVSKQINELMYFKIKNDVKEINDMLEINYMNYIGILFGKGKYSILNKEKDTLDEYLESVVGQVMLQASNRKELIEKINVKRDGKLLKSRNSLNAALEELGHNYYIKQFPTSRIANGKKKNYKSAWKVMKLVN